MNAWLLMRIGRALRLLLGGEQSERQLDEELNFHLQRQIEQNIASGMNPEEARLAARRSFGGVEQIKRGVSRHAWN
jgi:putative ABC transport system permease protein